MTDRRGEIRARTEAPFDADRTSLAIRDQDRADIAWLLAELDTAIELLREVVMDAAIEAYIRNVSIRGDTIERIAAFLASHPVPEEETL